VCWFARDVTNAVALRAILLAFLISDSVGLIVTVQGILSGVLNSLKSFCAGARLEVRHRLFHQIVRHNAG